MLEYRKKGERRLTEMQARARFWMSAHGQLSAAEQQAFEQALSENDQLKKDYEGFQRSLTRLSNLAQLKTDLSPSRGYVESWLHRLNTTITPQRRHFAKAAALGLLTFFVIIKTPWRELLSPEPETIFLTQVPLQSSELEKPDVSLAKLEAVDKSLDVIKEKLLQMSSETPDSVANDTESSKPKLKPKPKTDRAPASDSAATVAEAQRSKAAEVSQESAKTNASKESKETTESTDSTETAAVEPAQPDQANQKAVTGNPFVFRVFMFLAGVETIAEDMIADLKDLGAVKAGQVPLGWKQEKGRYFHFKIDENKYDKVLEALKKYGPLTIQKDKHSRVMPAGTFRFIVWVEETS